LAMGMKMGSYRPPFWDLGERGPVNLTFASTAFAAFFFGIFDIAHMRRARPHG